MSRTHRFDPEMGNAAVRERRRVRREALDNEMLAAMVDQDDKGIPPGYVIARMSDRVDFVVSMLVRMGYALEGEREDYKHRYFAALLKGAQRYDPSYRTPDGRRVAPLHFLRVIESRLTPGIIEHAKLRKRLFSSAQIVSTERDEEPADGRSKISVESSLVSDRCKSVRDLEFKMTLDVFYAGMTPLERTVLNARMSGLTYEEATQVISAKFHREFAVSHIRKIVIPSIREKAIRCGFERPINRRKEK